MKEHANIIEELSYKFNKKFLVEIPVFKNGFLNKQKISDIKHLNIDSVLAIAITIDGIPMIYKQSVKLVKLLEKSDIMLQDYPVEDYELKKGEFLSVDNLQ